jgi:hypothetical protein
MIEISPELESTTLDAISAVLDHGSENFSALVKLSMLDKKTDFQHVDLSGVDFSNSDLRGFNFTGSNLSHCYGVNVIYDDSTILDNASVMHSILYQEVERRSYFKANPEHHDLYKRLRDDYWASGAIWIGQNLKRGAKNFDAASKVAKFLYASVRDQTYKNQILYGINSVFERDDEYKYFLLTQLSLPGNSNRTIRALVDILGRAFGKDDLVREMLLLYSDHPLPEVRKVCIPAVMAKRFFLANRERIIRNVYSETDKICRKLYTREFSSLGVRSVRSLLFREDEGSFHDYAQVIDDRRFQVLVTAAIRRLKISHKIGTLQGPSTSPTSVKYIEFLHGVELYDAALQGLCQLGLPLKLTYSRERYMRELKALKTRQNGAEPVLATGYD